MTAMCRDLAISASDNLARLNREAAQQIGALQKQLEDAWARIDRLRHRARGREEMKLLVLIRGVQVAQERFCGRARIGQPKL